MKNGGGYKMFFGSILLYDLLIKSHKKLHQQHLDQMISLCCALSIINRSCCRPQCKSCGFAADIRFVADASYSMFHVLYKTFHKKSKKVELITAHMQLYEPICI